MKKTKKRAPKKARAEDSQPLLPGFRTYPIRDYNPVSGNLKKCRWISDPNAPMRDLHASLIRYIRRLQVPMPNSTACRRGDSALKNVWRHYKRQGKGFNRYLVLLDISSAYNAVRMDRLVEVLLSADPELVPIKERVENFLHDYCMDPRSKGLVTGAPASPELFNLYCEVLIDRPLRELCEKYSLVYTRYLDDMTFSSLGPIGRKKRRALLAVIRSVGFSISDKKARVIDLRKGPATVNGVGICLDGRIFLPRRTLTHIRGVIHQAMLGKVKPSVIHGKMGLLKGITPRYKANATEHKVFEAYDAFCKVQRTLSSI